MKSKAGIKRLTPEIKSCIQKSKSAHWEWQMAGRPDANHPTTQKRQEEKRNLRRKAQRINGAIERNKTYSEIMKASKRRLKVIL
jgi:glyoxylate carboligase